MRTINGINYYESGEVASRLNCTLGMLGYYRREGRITGMRIGTTTLYTEEAVNSIDTSRKRRGPNKRQREAVSA